MLKNVFKALAVAALALSMAGCSWFIGEKVTVNPGEVAKIQTKTGYKEGFITNRTFRLDSCITYCDSLVKFDATVRSRSETIKLVFPEDRIEFQFDLTFTFYVPEERYDEVFTLVRPSKVDDQFFISIADVYNTFARDMLIEESRSFLTQFKIDDVIVNRETIGARLRAHLIEYMKEHSVVNVRYASITNEVWPAPILAAMEAAATKRESIATENAQLEVARVQHERMLEEEDMRREIEMRKASNDVQIAIEIGKSMTNSYVKYLELQALLNMSNNPNTVFTAVPLSPAVTLQR